jgi:DNA-binding NarL/FixJ family response regulator
MLTAQEKRTLFALLDTGDTNAAARQIYLSPKTVYTYTRNIGMKLNLSSILQVRQFIFSEFTVDTETGDIAAH